MDSNMSEKAKKYVDTFIKEISLLFDEGFDLSEYASNLYNLLNADGYSDNNIVSGKCDSRLYEYICDGLSNPIRSVNYNNYYQKIFEKVSSIYEAKLQEARKYNSFDSMYYKLYSSASSKRYMTAEILGEIIRNKIPQEQVNNFITNYINNKIVKELSIAHKDDMRLDIEECYKKLVVTPDDIRKFAIIASIIFGISWVSTFFYNKHQEKEAHQKANNKPNYSYSAHNTASQGDAELGVYDLDTNEFVIGVDHVARL